MALRKSVVVVTLVFLLFQNLVWGQDTSNQKSSTISIKSVPLSFDAQRTPFKETEAGKAYIKKYGRLPEVVDVFGHPMPPTPLKKQKPKVQRKKIEAPKPIVPKKQNVKSTFFKSILDFIIPSAAAYDYEADDNGHLTILNCRDAVPSNPNDPSNPGYFRAYFEDLAYNNGNGSEAGYDDLVRGPTRREAICEVLEEFADILMINEPGGATPEILFTKDWPQDAPLTALASAGPYMIGSISGSLHAHIITRNDPLTGPDAVVNTNWDQSIAWSIDTTLNAGTYDFKTVMRHEILHALGFMSRLPVNISATNIPFAHNHWDKNLYSPTGAFYSASLSPLLLVPVGNPSAWFVNNATTYQGQKNYVGAPLDGGRPVYSPSSWQQGSSLSHFDMLGLTPPNSQIYVMHPNISQNIEREIHPHEKEVLCHLGYQVRGMTGCTIPTPVANDDFGTFTSASPCINMLDNDFGFTPGGTLVLNDYQLISPASNASVLFYSGLNCLNQEVWPNPSVKSINVQIAFNETAPIIVKYRNKELNTNSLPVRISDPAIVNYAKCVGPVDDYLCNGNFEMGNVQGNPYGAPFWKIAMGSPDLVIQTTNANNTWWANLPTTFNSGSTQVNGLLPSQFAVSILNPHYNPGGMVSEKMTTTLKQPLEAGKCYTLSLDSVVVGTSNQTWQNDLLLNVSLNTTSMVVANYAEVTNPNLVSATSVMDEILPINRGSGLAPWVHLQRTFFATQAFTDLAIQMKNLTNPNTLNLFTYIDNVSLKKVDQSLCLNAPSISGMVYNDVNNSGSRDPNEAGLNGIVVGLYASSTALTPEMSITTPFAPIITTTTNNDGKYFFQPTNLNIANYYVAIVNESSVAVITEPLVNSSLINHTRARVVPFTPSSNVVQQNFGVILQGQPVVQPPLTITTTQNCNNFTLSIPSPSGVGYTYNWSGPNNFISTSATPIVSTAGTYTVTLIGPNGYSNTGSVTIYQNQIVQISGVTNVTINGASINTTMTGAAASSYSWSGPNNFTSTQQNLSGITIPGTYTVIANFGNSCTAQASFNIQPSCAAAPPASNFNTVLNSSNNVPVFQCYLSTSANGTSQCRFNTSNPTASNANWNAACPSTVAGSNCCGWTNVCGGGESSVPVTTISGSVTNLTTSNNGAINLTVSGAGPFTYQWSNGATTQNISNLAPGNYTVTVKNANGCPTQASFAVISPIQINLTQNFSCPSNNSISATVTGGIAPLTYRWYKNGVMYPSTTAPYTGLTPTSLSIGTYYLMVTDGAGQQVQSSSVTINAYSAPTIAVIKTDATATAYNNGTIKATVTGGLAPFNYYFTGLNAMTTGPIATNPYTRTGLVGNNDSPATYGVFVMDARYCSSNTVSGIKILRKLTATSSVVSNCSSGSNLPMIVVTPAGGHGTYSYEWKQGTTVLSNTGASLFGSAAGTYTVTVRDQSIPTPQAVTLTVTMPSTAPALHTVSVAVVGATNSQANGSATVTTTAGLGPYTYTYNPGTSYQAILANTHSRTGLAAGTYSVGVKTNYGCSVNKSFTITNTLTTASPKL